MFSPQGKIQGESPFRWSRPLGEEVEKNVAKGGTELLRESKKSYFIITLPFLQFCLFVAMTTAKVILIEYKIKRQKK